MKKRLNTLAGLTIGAMLVAINPSQAEELAAVRVIYTSIDQPVLKIADSPQVANFFVKVRSPDRLLRPSDFYCMSETAATEPLIMPLDNFEYQITCSTTFQLTTTSGIKNVSLKARTVNLIADNAVNTSPSEETDSFGQPNGAKTFDFNRFETLAFTSALIAVNPPQTFQYPQFPKEGTGYVLFDTRNQTFLPLKIAVNKKTKKVTINCPDPVIAKIGPIQKYHLLNLGSIPGARLTQIPKFNYLQKEFRGKNLILKCSTINSIKIGNFNLPIAYTESKPTQITFPAK